MGVDGFLEFLEKKGVKTIQSQRFIRFEVEDNLYNFRERENAIQVVIDTLRDRISKRRVFRAPVV